MLSEKGLAQPSQLDTARQGDVPCKALEPYQLGQGDYQVIRSISIKNFRGYQNLSVLGCKRINVITGQNASGKTALLEALYLALGANPELYFKIRTWRSLGDRIELTSPTMWNDLFHHFDLGKEITISYKGTSHHTRSLRVFVDKKRPIFIPVEERLPGPPQLPLTFEWKKGTKLVTVRPVFTKDGIRLHGTLDPVSASFFAAGAAISGSEVAGRFSNLAKQGDEETVKQAMRDLFPIVEDLSVLSQAGEPMVFAKLTGQRERVPLGLVSLGTNRVLAYLVAIFEHRNNAVLIDEIEGGIYYRAMPALWKTLLRFCIDNNTQLFVSTHSLEALKSLLPVMKEHGDDRFALFRNSRAKDGTCNVRHVEGEYFESALEEGMEVR